MVDRIVTSPSQGFKVSRPGVDVHTAQPQDLLLGGSYESMGVFASGQIAGNQRTYFDGLGGVVLTRCLIPNPAGRIPFVVCQVAQTADQSISIHTEDNFQYFRDLADEAIPTFTNYINGSASAFSYSVGVGTITTSTRGMGNPVIRYAAFYPRSGEPVYPAGDQIPDGFGLTSKTQSSDSVTTDYVTISGLDDGVTTFLKVVTNVAANSTYTMTATVQSQYPLRAGGFTIPNGSNQTLVEVGNGDRLALTLKSNDGGEKGVFFSVYNSPQDTDTLLATCTLVCRYFDYQPDPLNWTNVSGATTAWTNTQTINGLNSYITIYPTFDPPFTGALGVNTTTPNTSLSAASQGPQVGCFNGTTIYWSFSPSANYAGTVTIRNNYRGGEVIDTFTVNVTASPPKIVGDWNVISDYNFVDPGKSGTAGSETNRVTISNIGSGGHTMGVSLNLAPPAGGFRCRIIRGGSDTLAFTMTGSTTSASVTVQNGDQVYFAASRTGPGFYNYGAVVTITDQTAGVSVDQFNISLSQDVNGV